MVKRHTLGDVMRPGGTTIILDPAATYREVTVRLFGKGVELRRECRGSDIGSTQRVEVSAGQFIVSKIDARNGAFGLVPPELDRAVVSGDFPVFDVVADALDPRYLGYLSRTEAFVDLCRHASEGSTNRVRLTTEKFLALPTPFADGFPRPQAQRRAVARIETQLGKVGRTRALRRAQLKELDGLLSAQLYTLSAGAERRSLSDVAPLYRRPVEVDLHSVYPQVSARSFGRGTFHKESLKGADITWQKPYRVEAGDILVSNIKAWEGAVAVALPEDHNRFGSHRYLTLVPRAGIATAEYLVHYLLSPEGLHSLGEASPGSADRNRTLGTKALGQIEVPVPSFADQVEFTRLVNQVRSIRGAFQPLDAQLEGLEKSILNHELGLAAAKL